MMRLQNFIGVIPMVLLVACSGGDDQGGNGGSGPAPDVVVCAEQHPATTPDGFDVIVCDRTFDEAPFVRLPEPRSPEDAPTSLVSFATLTGPFEFTTPEGARYQLPQSGGGEGASGEVKRRGFTIYQVSVDEAGSVGSYRPFVILNERILLEPFDGRVLEGEISRRIVDDPGQELYELDATLPVRLRVDGIVELEERLEGLPEGSPRFGLRLVVENLDADVTAGDGACVPSLRSHGDADPFAGAAEVVLSGSRVPDMHGLGDDEFVIEYLRDGLSAGSVMAPAWYVQPGDVIREKVALSGSYSGTGHGAPGSLPQLDLELADGGGGACTPSP